MRDEAMKERREYQHLEEVLKQEKAGSAKIRALAHWLMQEKIYDYAVASRNREHLCDSVRALDMRGKRAAHASRMERRGH